MKERLMRVKGSGDLQEVDDMYINTIKAKLELLQEKEQEVQPQNKASKKAIKI